MVEASQEDREVVRSMLKDVAEFVRQRYELPIPEIAARAPIKMSKYRSPVFGSFFVRNTA